MNPSPGALAARLDAIADELAGIRRIVIESGLEVDDLRADPSIALAEAARWTKAASIRLREEAGGEG